MTEHLPLDHIDAELLNAVREVYARVDPVPADLTDRVKFALTVQALHAEVAELIAAEPVLTRGPVEPDETTTVTFSTEALSIMLTVSQTGPDRSRLDGWLTCGSADVELTMTDGATWQATADSGGRFAVENVPSGSARLLVRSHDDTARPVITPVFSI